MKFYYLFLFVLLIGFSAQAQNDSSVVRSIYDEVLLNGQAYDNLKILCTSIGHRLSGSPAADKAVIWGANTLRAAGADTVYLQEVQVPVWVRGNKEVVRVSSGKLLRPLQACSLGGSVGTNGFSNGLLNAEVIEVVGVEELIKLTEKDVKGKIVFFNKPMDPRKISTFEAYGACVDQRHAGAGEAAKLGAVAVLVRSMSLAIDEHPHTGSMGYPEGAERIPALAISTLDANWLHKELANGKKGSIKVGIESNCEFKGYKTSYNVIGELRGAKNPERIMVVGGHLDSWDKGQGAHDDGAGCVQSIETLRLFKTLGIRPNNTLRVILFMNEENGNMGGKTYAKNVNAAKEKHVLAFESDRGGFTPRGVHMDANLQEINTIAEFKVLLEYYGLHVFEKGYSGVDISPLKHAEGSFNPEIMMLGLLPDSQRYFDYHHADTDVIEAVNPRELHLGAGAMAALVYLIDKNFQFK